MISTTAAGDTRAKSLRVGSDLGGGLGARVGLRLENTMFFRMVLILALKNSANQLHCSVLSEKVKKRTVHFFLDWETTQQHNLIK